MKREIKKELRTIGIDPTKSLGQHFLWDRDIARRIVEGARIESVDKVLEIGPGTGVLTEFLVEEPCELTLIEKDSRLVEHLEREYGDRVEMIKGDVLDVELPKFDRVVSNLPFSISSPVTFKLLEKDFKRGVLTYQKQYAERMLAKPGESDHSRLSVMVSTYADVERLFDIKRDRFYPPPKVHATVIKLSKREPEFDLKYPDAYAEVVKQLFNYRRKKIKNGLQMGFDIDDDLERLPYKDRRIENLDLEQISELTNFLVERGMIDKPV